MKKYLVVGDSSYVAEELARTELFRDFLADTVGDTARVDMVLYDEIVLIIEKGSYKAIAPGRSVDLQTYDALYLRGKRLQEYFLAKFCAFHGIKCINDYSNFYSGTKLAQAVIFLEAGVDFLRTYYAQDKATLATYVAEHEGYPFILKANKGSHGDSNYLIRTEADWRRVFDDEPDIEFIAQEYCENDRDYRLLLAGNEALLFERRGGSGTHLNNTSKGGVASKLPLNTLSTETIAQAKSLAGTLGLHVAGFDVIPRLHTDARYFLEINFQPQLRTGVLLAEKQKLLRKLFESF